MAGDRIERLHYFQRQFLGATDFEDQQDYHRCMRQRHHLGPHTWGVVTGLRLVEVESEGGSGIDVYVLPGLAVDGFGREILVLEPHRLDAQLFERFRNQPHRFPEVHIGYREEAAGHPRVGFDPCADPASQFTRLRETFEIFIDPEPPLQDPLVVAGRTPAVEGVELEEEPPGVLAHLRLPRDESVPHQEIPDEAQDPRWLIRLGTVHWHVDQLLPDERDPPVLNQGRRHAGLVASSILAPDGRLILRHRHAPDPLPLDEADPFHEGLQAQLQGSLTVDRDALVGRRAGVGTDDPQAPLHVLGGEPAGLGTHGHAVFGPLDGANLVLDGDDLQARADGDAAMLHLQREGGGISLHGATPETGLVLDADGRVGIGTANPQVKLHVDGGDDAEVAEDESGYLVVGDVADRNLVLDPDEMQARNAGVRALLHLQRGGGGIAIHQDRANSQVRIQHDGRVGIGTTNPRTRLHVTQGTDVTLAPEGGYLLLGEVDGLNVAFDDNEIQARNNGGAARLSLQHLGGHLRIHQGAQAAHFDTDGRVGLGTESPRARLHVREGLEAGLGDDSGFVVIGDVDGTNLVMDTNEIQGRVNGATSRLLLQPHGGNVGIGTTNPRVRLHIDNGADVDLADDDGFLVLGPVNAENVAFDANEIQARNNGAAATLHLQAEGGDFRLHSQQPDSREFIVTDGGSVGIGTPSPQDKLDVRGTVRATNFVPTSDRRLKTAIEPVEDALARLRRLRGVHYRWKQEHAEAVGLDDEPHLGFIAQEVAEVLPELVRGGAEDEAEEQAFLSLDVLGLVPVLLEAVKELAQRVDDLETQLAEQA